MLETIAVILIILWLLGMVSGYTLGNFIYILLVIAIVLFLVRLISGRRSDPAIVAEETCRNSAASRDPALFRAYGHSWSPIRRGGCHAGRGHAPWPRRRTRARRRSPSAT